jgi:ribosome-binding factor A
VPVTGKKGDTIMLEGKRQKQVAGLINEELNDIFLRMGFTMMDGGMVSISSVKITPDLFDARVYLSLFKVNDNLAVLKKIDEKNKDIRHELGKRVRHQLRSIPQLTFYIDDTLDYVDKMDELFKKIKDEEGK